MFDVTQRYKLGDSPPRRSLAEGPRHLGMSREGRFFAMRQMFAVFTLLSFLAPIGVKGNDIRPNVLFIAVDDLRPELGCYARSHIKSPHTDRLANRGVTFTRAYCQMASCCPSRSSLLTGLPPDVTQVYGNHTHFREHVPDVVTLPQHFKQHGYHTQALGKIFHGAYETAHGGRAMDDAPSWSEPTWFGSQRNYFSPQGIASAKKEFARKSGKRGAALEAWVEEPIRSLAMEAPDVADDVLYDGAMTNRAVETLRQLKEKRQPFFLAVGYTRPHLPLVAPKKYWDLYDPERIELAEHDALPQSAPEQAASPSELRNYTGMPRSGPLTPEQARHVRHGYYACISFVDAQIGRLLDELDRQGLSENTIIVLWGDHGWHLGEFGLWGKNTNFEDATRVPLIVVDPRVKSARETKCNALVGLIDLYPTLCELAGLARPNHLAGESFARALTDPKLSVRKAVFSQHPRPGFTNFTTMGYSIRTDRHRLTLWQSVTGPRKTEAIELYDYQIDPLGIRNVANDDDRRALIEELSQQLQLAVKQWKE